MPHVLLVVVLIGLGDSLNPTTLGPAMFLATTPDARRRLAQFLLGLIAVNLIGGAVIMLGPGQLLLDLVPKPKPTAKHVLELIAGVALIVIASLLWSGRRALGRRTPPSFEGGGRSSLALGAGIGLVELPTAVPYFAAIAVIVGSGLAIPGKLVALVGYNLAFVAPILAMLLALLVLGDKAEPRLEAVNRWVLGHWPGVLAGMAALVGAGVFAVGLIALAS